MLTVSNILLRRELSKFSEALRGEEEGRVSEGTESISFPEFKRRFWHKYQDALHQQAIEWELAKVALYLLTNGEQGISRLMIFCPPRHGKTQNVSRFFPAWLLGQNPDLRLILASYGTTLAERNSRFVRNLIQTDEYRALFPETKLAEGSAAVDIWDIANHDGGAIAVGVGAGVTGHGANLIVIDDVVKSRAEAESETYRDKTTDWYNNDLLTRLEEPGGAIILMMTRWHTADLAGYLLENEPDEWVVLSMPALAEADDPLEREEGAALWPARYPVEIIEKRRESMGEYPFSSIYQQSPLPAGGRLFDTECIEVVDYVPECAQVVRFYDLAVTEKTRADYTVGLKLGITKDERPVILDVYRVQKETPDVQEGIVQNAVMDGMAIRIRLEAEKAGIIQLQYLLRDKRLHSYTIDGVPPVGDKYTRASPVAARINASRVMMVRAAWNRAFLDELSTFPLGSHDDQVDALSGAYEMLAAPQFTPGTTTSNWKN